MSHEIEIHRATPGRLQDFLTFFDRDAFADNPDWGNCFCQCYFLDHKKIKWGERTLEENRRDAIAQVSADKSRGLIAYLDGKAIGWCNTDARNILPPLRGYSSEESEVQENVASFFCFLVAKPYRGRGIMKQLFAAACEHMEKEGFNILEAYPDKNPQNDADKFHGSLKMFLDAGFAVHKEDPTKGRLTVRKYLR